MRWHIASSIFIATLLPHVAHAQFASEIFHPQASESTSTWSTAHADVLEHLIPSAGLVVHFADDPVELVSISADGRESSVATLLDEQLKLDALLAIGLFDIVEIGAAFPVVLYQNGDAFEGFDEVGPFSIADTRVSVRARIWRGYGFGLAVQAMAFIPSAESGLQSDGEPRFLPTLIADYADDDGLPFRAAMNVGYEFRAENALTAYAADDRLHWNVGAEFGVIPDRLNLMASVFGSLESASDVRSSFASEAQGGVKVFWPVSGLSSTLGAGTALSSGTGSPDVRLIASVGYAPSATDLDSDGVLDEYDGCSDGVEDIDGFEDQDGCPDLDNDRDMIADVDDACPNEAEDIDGFEDRDGCPDPDNDGDGIFDVNDACPLDPGPPEKEGCPLIDEDGDGVDDTVDQCPEGAEDIDGFEDEDGCPDLDNDRDGIPDAKDACPNQKETINGVEDEDGCPDEGASAVRLTDARIEILERVYFDTGEAKIKPVSHRVLDQVASVLKARPDITRLRVEGHTDARGADSANLELSQRRAAAVREYLIGKGVSSERLAARGYGESHPLADNQSAQGREANRRVEFHIIERNVDGR